MELYIDNNKKICCAILYDLMSTSKRLSVFVFTAGLAIVLIFGSSFPNALSLSYLNKGKSYYASPVKLIDTVNRSSKVVMINFDDGRKSQLIYAKPILDKYGFKASFFIICGRVGTERSSMNWQDIAELKKDGMDIESHSMTHTNLNRLSTNALKFEIGGSKQCFAKHGYNTPIFGYPFNLGSNKPSVVNLVAKYYNFGRSGTDRLMFLDCRGYMKDTQTDCRTYLPNGMLTHANRYDIRSASFYHVSNEHNFTPAEMFHVFLQIVNGQTPYNSNGKINSIPIIVYHNITNSIRDYTIPSHASSTTLDLFAQEMKYLHNNGFRVLLLNQLGYDPNNNVFYIKG
ncbi:MAG: polysaccharide deacetylase family protein [Candidatus Nitrosopolaris sp.]